MSDRRMSMDERMDRAERRLYKEVDLLRELEKAVRGNDDINESYGILQILTSLDELRDSPRIQQAAVEAS